MSAPTLQVRKTVYQRDHEACVSCNRRDSLTFQHRAAVGMGGSRIKPPPPAGIALCLLCNQACEAELQSRALAYGWKIRRHMDPHRVPVYYPHEFGWFLLTGGTRQSISSEIAVELMCAAHGAEWYRWWEEVIYG